MDTPESRDLPLRGYPSAQPLPAFADLGVELPALVSLGVVNDLEVLAFAAVPVELLPWWRRLREIHELTGLWPLLVGDGPGGLWSAHPDAPVDHDDAAAILARCEGVTPQQLPALRRARSAAQWGSIAYLGNDGNPEDDDDPAPGRLTPQEESYALARHDGYVALVPVQQSWQVPAVLGWVGGIDYDLDPLDHAVTLRDWQQRFGAELVGVGGDDQVLELRASRPPTETSVALAVAYEHWDYCVDAVEDGATEHAATVVSSRAWSFWWD